MEDSLEFAGRDPFFSPLQRHAREFKRIFDIRNECRNTSSSPSHFEDFGRESLGIIDPNHPDFARESLGFLHDEFGRESLGIVNLNNLDIGRVSLGITNINTYDFVVSNVNLLLDSADANDIKNSANSILNNEFKLPPDASEEIPEISTVEISNFNELNEKVSDILLPEPNDNNNFVSSVLNDAFLESVVSSSISSSISSVNPSFNSDANDIKNCANSISSNEFKLPPDKHEEISEISPVRIFNFNEPNLKVPDIMLSEPNDSNNLISSILNTAFLNPAVSSVSSSTSSVNPSFNSGSLESSVPSRISSASNGTDIMNNAFEDTSQFVKEMDLYGRSWTLSTNSSKKIENSNVSHRRICSLPTALGIDMKHEFEDENFPNLKHNSKDGQICSQPEQLDTTNLDLDVGDETFNDSVFIEANHFASKVAEGSIVGLDELDNDMLDSTQEPDEFAKGILSDDEEPVKYDTETVFKVVDKVFVPFPDKIQQNLPENLNGSSKISEKSDNSNCTSKSNNSKSKDAMEIITSLSEILNNDNRSEKQKSEGQNLLSSLADILLSSASTKSRSCILDDSGHSSSIESEPIPMSEGGELYEALDLRKKSISKSSINQMDSYENCVPLDLSSKSKSSNSAKAFASAKILPPRFSKNFQKPLNESKKLNVANMKLRPKKTEEKMSNLGKGPMKAVLPVTNMSKRNSGGLIKVTPTRQESHCKLKKTSTPINESNLKPMAQSTPDTPRITCPTSPLARPSASLYTNPTSAKQKLNYSGSSLPINKSMEAKTKTQSFSRRGSSGDLKKSQNIRKFVRSYSVGEKSEFSSKIKDVKKSSLLSFKRQSSTYSKTETSTSVLKENISKSIRSLVAKKNGKENLH